MREPHERLLQALAHDRHAERRHGGEVREAALGGHAKRRRVGEQRQGRRDGRVERGAARVERLDAAQVLVLARRDAVLVEAMAADEAGRELVGSDVE